MRLLDSLPILIFIGRIVLHVNASLPSCRRPLWFPGDQPAGNFMRDVERSLSQTAPSPHVDRKPAKNRWCRFGSSSTTESPEISTDSHAEVANYFNQRYYSKHKDDKEKFLKEVFSYLASPALTPNLLSHWLPALESACEHHKTFGVHRELILYGLHTLILQNYQNRGLTQTIYVAVNRLMESQKIWFARYFPNGLLEWSRELLTPASGLSSKLGTWEQFDQMLRSEPNLNTLRQAIGNQEPSLGSKLEPIERIFSEPPPKNVSAQTRVAAIGLLTHAKRINDRTRTEVFNLITRLLANQTRYFLFPHEKTLLNYVPGRHA